MTAPRPLPESNDNPWMHAIDKAAWDLAAQREDAIRQAVREYLPRPLMWANCEQPATCDHCGFLVVPTDDAYPLYLLHDDGTMSRVVPAEPTPEMIERGAEAVRKMLGGDWQKFHAGDGLAEAVLRAVLGSPEPKSTDDD